ncbi:MAG: hypothetical protein ACO331_05355 [Prochlorothrix sp.]
MENAPQENPKNGHHKPISESKDLMDVDLLSLWQDFVRNQVAPVLIDVFCDRGFKVNMSSQGARSYRENHELAVDMMVTGANVVVVVTVDYRLSVATAQETLYKAERFKDAFVNYSNHKVYGAVSGVVVDRDPALYAEYKGLFVLEPAGNSVIISNRPNFEPRYW